MDAAVFKTVDPVTGDVTLTGRGSEWMKGALAKGLLASDAADNAKYMLNELYAKDKQIEALEAALWVRCSEVQAFRRKRIREYDTQRSHFPPTWAFIGGILFGGALAAIIIAIQYAEILGI